MPLGYAGTVYTVYTNLSMLQNLGLQKQWPKEY